jgi:hypothetical protein
MKPTYLTRYAYPGEDPFVSLNDLPYEQANALKRRHCRRNNIGGFYAQDNYLLHRREIEHWITRQLLKKGGAPKDSAPVYMTLGPSPTGEFDIRQDIQRDHIEIIIPVEELDLATVTFTFPDSMYELTVDQHGTVIDGKRTNTPVVYVYHELDEVIDRYRVYAPPYELYIEVQVWDREPLSRLLAQNAHFTGDPGVPWNQQEDITSICLCSGKFCKSELSEFYDVPDIALYSTIS